MKDVEDCAFGLAKRSNTISRSMPNVRRRRDFEYGELYDILLLRMLIFSSVILLLLFSLLLLLFANILIFFSINPNNSPKVPSIFLQ